MAKLEEVEPLLKACLGNAERLLESAKAVQSVSGSGHIAYHLAVLALEEIGKSILIFQESLDPKPLPRDPEGGPRSPLDWLEDHERKLFWAIWLPISGEVLDWRTIPPCMELAKEIHLKRLHSLYFDPRFPAAQRKIAADEVGKLIGLAEIRLDMEKLKKYRDLSDKDNADLQWFFSASADPQIKTWIYSKVSLEKQAELANEPNGWIRWLRGLVEESERAAAELASKEMTRVKPGGDERHDDKWLFKIRLKSWSHSIRANQLTKWNEAIDKIKLFTTDDRHELIVQFIMPKSITIQEIWPAGMQQCMIFVTALNIATAGGPFNPGFGLSGAVLQLDRAFPPPVRVFVLSIPTRSLRVLQRRLRGGESCSTASSPDNRITLASPDCSVYSAASPQTVDSFEY